VLRSLLRILSAQDDETLPNFIKRKHPRKGEKKKQGAGTKVQAKAQELKLVRNFLPSSASLGCF
jgi:hypothetical protein